MKKKYFRAQMYAKMYLVTPMVYEKLKMCLSKSDLSSLESLNKPFSFTPQSGNQPFHPWNPPSLQPPSTGYDKLQNILKSEKETQTYFYPPGSGNDPGEEFEHPRGEYFDDPYYSSAPIKQEESEPSNVSFEFDDRPIDWDTPPGAYGFQPVGHQEASTQTNVRLFDSSSQTDPTFNPQMSHSGIQTDPQVTQTIETQTEPPFSHSIETQTDPQITQSIATQTNLPSFSSTMKKKKPKKEKTPDVSVPLELPPPIQPQIVFQPSAIPHQPINTPTQRQKAIEDQRKKFKAIEDQRKKHKAIEHQQKKPLDYRGRLIRHIEHFGLPVARRQPTQISPSQLRGIVPYTSVEPTIASISTNLPRIEFPPDDPIPITQPQDYTTPILQPELMYREPPKLTYNPPLRLEYQPSEPKEVKTYSRVQKRGLKRPSNTDLETKPPKTFINPVRRLSDSKKINLPKTYSRTVSAPYDFKKFDGKFDPISLPDYHQSQLDVIEQFARAEDQNLAQKFARPQKKFLCDLCGQTLSTAFNLARHRDREIRRLNRKQQRDEEYQLWFKKRDENKGERYQPEKRSSTEAEFIPQQHRKKQAAETDDYPKWND